ncbi:MAG: glycosyltransferase family 4 protein, partial [Dehalococcoidales bacterium]
KFPVTTVVSPMDKKFLNKLNKKADVRVIPNGVDINYFSARDVIEEDYPSILFFGTMDFSPNVDAALYIYHEILPLIRVKIPNVKFYIAGADPSPEIKKLAKDNNIIVTGFIEDIRFELQRANVVLVPMRKGSGIKNKILEAMAMETPIVTNSIGAEALSEEAKNCLLIGDTADAIADHVVNLLINPERGLNLAKRGRTVVMRQYTWDGVAKQYEELYLELLNKR